MPKSNNQKENTLIEWMSEERIVFLSPKGDFTREGAEEIVNGLDKIFNSLPADEKVNFIVNASGTYKTNHEARRIYTKFTKDYRGRVPKIAVYNANTFTKLVVQFVVNAVGKDTKIKFFDNFNDCLKWVKEKK